MKSEKAEKMPVVYGAGRGLVKCDMCGHEWESLNFMEIYAAAKVNQAGPYCELCRNLVMATRAAALRNLTITEAVLQRQEALDQRNVRYGTD